ncbi:amidase [Catenulispora yoronensis]|uniref:Amidase n=1 Tax=Catenulispora yoronensis TaxID=450799 RepID=A0ABP5EWY4_9ACTN
MNRKTSGSQPTPQSPGVNDAFVGWIPVLDAAEDRGGPLGGVRLAVKDVLDVAGLPTGAGHPRWLATHDVPARDATAVARLRAAGATVVGKTHTDELAYSLGGTSRHYGAAPNPAAPDRLTGGSSGGAASAVAGGLADLSLATDTAGSIRIPASYCGLYGLRPTHGRVPADGIVPLAPSFDVAGLLTRRLELLTVAAGVLLDPAPGTAAPARLWAPADLWSQAAPAVREALARELARFDLPVDRTPMFDRLEAWHAGRAAFSLVQAFEAWGAHGAWITRERPEFGPGVGARFENAGRVGAAECEEGRAVVRGLGERLVARLGDGTVLAIPTAPAPAPLRLRLGGGPGAPGGPGRTELAADPALRAAIVGLTCLAGAAGAPALSIPGAIVDGAPVGLCLVGAPGADEDLLDLAAQADEHPPGPTAGAHYREDPA